MMWSCLVKLIFLSLLELVLGVVIYSTFVYLCMCLWSLSIETFGRLNESKSTDHEIYCENTYYKQCTIHKAYKW